MAIPDWPFADSPYTEVITVRQIINDKQPILLVVRDAEDYRWQFLTADSFGVADGMVESLRHMLRLDPTIADLIDLQPGWQAIRKAVGEPWQRSERSAPGFPKETLRAEIRDAKDSISVLFTWGHFEPEREDCCLHMTLCYRYPWCGSSDFRVTTEVGQHGVGPPLLKFLEEVAALSGDWDGPREFWNEDYYYGAKNFGITCFGCRKGKIHTEVTLDADVIDPVWTIKLRLEVAQSAWPGIVKQFRDFFAVTNGWE